EVGSSRALACAAAMARGSTIGAGPPPAAAAARAAPVEGAPGGALLAPLEFFAPEGARAPPEVRPPPLPKPLRPPVCAIPLIDDPFPRSTGAGVSLRPSSSVSVEFTGSATAK